MIRSPSTAPLGRTPARSLVAAAACALTLACGGDSDGPVDPVALVGALIIDGTGSPPLEAGVLVVRDGRIEAVGPADSVDVPRQARVVDVSGRTIIPGLVNAHGHVGGVRGLESGHYDDENLLRQLTLYARYGVTTVVSLGGDGPEGVELREVQEVPGLARARLFVAGEVVTGATPEEALVVVDRNVALGADFIKIRVDDNLGTATKMTPDVYRAVIDAAHASGRPLAAHVFYLDDARDLLAAGADFIAHSVRDQPVDDDFARALAASDVCYSPTLMREVSTFVYRERPDFFDDPFFQRYADPAAAAGLQEPERQQAVRDSDAAAAYEEALAVATDNLGRLWRAGVKIAMGTDTGPPGRFQGYFEHLELEAMTHAGMDPMAVLVAATGQAASCMGLEGVGTLEAGNWADFLVLSANPLDDIRATREVEFVYMAGERMVDDQ